MSCATDSNQTNHPYPRGGDPAFDKWLKITAKTTNTFTVNVGVSSDTSAHTFVSAGTNSVKKALTTVTIAGMLAPLTNDNGTWGIKDIYSDTEFTLDIDLVVITHISLLANLPSTGILLTHHTNR